MHTKQWKNNKSLKKWDTHSLLYKFKQTIYQWKAESTADSTPWTCISIGCATGVSVKSSSGFSGGQGPWTMLITGPHACPSSKHQKWISYTIQGGDGFKSLQNCMLHCKSMLDYLCLYSRVKHAYVQAMISENSNYELSIFLSKFTQTYQCK